MANKVPKQATFREILLDRYKMADQAENTLAKLFRDMLAERSILPAQWDARMDAYYRKVFTNSKGEVDIIKVNQEKSNLKKALAKPNLAWNRFETAIQVLNPDEYTFSLGMKYINETEYLHQIKVKNRSSRFTPPPAEEDDDE